MAALPIKPLPTGSVTIEGTDIPIRALSRSEVIRLQSFEGNEDGAEPFVIAAGTGCTEEEARAFLASTDLVTGGDLLVAIFRLTGLAAADPQKGSTGEGPAERPSSEP